MDLVLWSSPRCRQGGKKLESFMDIICTWSLTQSRKLRPCRRLNTLQKKSGMGLHKSTRKNVEPALSLEQDVCHPEPRHACRGKSIYGKPLKGFFQVV